MYCANGCNINTLLVSFHTKFYRQTSCCTSDGVSTVLGIHIWTRDSPHFIRKRGTQSISISNFDFYRQGHFRMPLAATWQAYWSNISHFSGKCFSGALWRCTSNCGAKFVSSTTKLQHITGNIPGSSQMRLRQLWQRWTPTYEDSRQNTVQRTAVLTWNRWHQLRKPTVTMRTLHTYHNT
jgi:hypothetical protein